MRLRIALALLLISSCAESGSSESDNETRQATSLKTSWTVTKIVDGDTIEVRNESRWEDVVRLIGIDTPEKGRCGFQESSQFLTELLEGKVVELVKGGTQNRDRYGRHLRYVEIEGIDVGRALLDAGWAIARYDSRDGYGEHLREDEYILADDVSTNLCPDSAWDRE